MKKNILLIVGFLIFNANSTFGQSQADTIQTKKGISTVFIQNGKKLSAKKLLEITKTNSEAYKEMKIAKSNYDVGNVLAFMGGALIGWNLGEALRGAKPDWSLSGVGAGLIVIGIPFSSSYLKHTKKAVRIYNNGTPKIGLRKINFNLGIANNGFKLRMRF